MSFFGRLLGRSQDVVDEEEQFQDEYQGDETPADEPEIPDDEIVEEDEEFEATIADYLESLELEDCDAIAAKGRDAGWAKCQLDSNCGQHMQEVIDLCKALVDACPDLSEEETWEIWFQVERQLSVFYHG